MSEAAGDHRVFPPPDQPVECFCLHCGRVYMSNLILPIDIDGEIHYACPVPDCTAMGWNFDIFPVSDEVDAEGGWIEDDDESDEDFEDAPAGDTGTLDPALDEETNIDSADSESFDPPRDWTPELDREDEDEESAYDVEAELFTQEEYDRLKKSGEIDRKIEQIRKDWTASAKRRTDPHSPPGDGTSFRDEDIPF